MKGILQIKSCGNHVTNDSWGRLNKFVNDCQVKEICIASILYCSGSANSMSALGKVIQSYHHLIPVFSHVKWLGIFLLPLGWDRMSVHHWFTPWH